MEAIHRTLPLTGHLCEVILQEFTTKKIFRLNYCISSVKGVKDSNIRASYQKEKLKVSVCPSSTGWHLIWSAPNATNV